jgi:hypothetical protein
MSKKIMNLKEYFELGGELTEGHTVRNNKDGEVKFIKRNDADSITIEKSNGVRWSVSNWMYYVDNVKVTISVV